MVKPFLILQPIALSVLSKCHPPFTEELCYLSLGCIVHCESCQALVAPPPPPPSPKSVTAESRWGADEAMGTGGLTLVRMV